MKHQTSKTFLIAIAAVAVSASSMTAYASTTFLSRAGLSPQQIEALTEARELITQGESKKARDLLLEAGVDEKTLSSIKQAAKEAKRAVEVSLQENDFAAFKLAIADSPLGDIITTEADFTQFKEARDLQREGNFAEASELFAALGVPAEFQKSKRNGHHHYGFLSPSEREALQVAHQGNDLSAVKAILREAGFEHEGRHGTGKGRW